MSAQLELTDDARARIRELQALSEKAESGDTGARRELRRAVKESTPEVVARCADIARTYRWIVADTSSGRDPLVQEAIVEQARRMAHEIAGESPTPLEVLLAERIASLWVLVEAQEAPTVRNLQTRTGETRRTGLRYPDVQDSRERKPPLPRRDKDARTSAKVAGQHAGHSVQHTNKCRAVGWSNKA